MSGFWLISITSVLGVSAAITALIFSFVGAWTLGKKPHNQIGRGCWENRLSVPLAGILLAPAALASSLLVLGISSFWNASAVKTSLWESGFDSFLLICALLILFLLGICKDLSRVRESVKFIVVGVCAILVAVSSKETTSLQGFPSMGETPPVVSVILAFLVVLSSVIAVGNIVDRLQRGNVICSIALLYYSVILFESADYILSTIAAAFLGSILIGACFKKAKPLLRLGSTGAFTTGLVLSVIAIGLCLSRTQTDGSTSTIAAILGLAPIIILIIWGAYLSLKGHKTQ